MPIASSRDPTCAVWVDTEGIGDGMACPPAVRSAIEESDAFVFVMPPNPWRRSIPSPGSIRRSS